jgi:hypothetical protein
MRKRIRMRRLISNGVPSKNRTGGKNSSREGPWKPLSPDPSSVARVMRVRAWCSSAISRIGARHRAAMKNGGAFDTNPIKVLRAVELALLK